MLQPLCQSVTSSPTEMLFNCFRTLFTFHSTAPMEFTTTSFDYCPSLCVVSPSTTQQLTAIDCLTRSIAQTSFRSECPSFLVGLAEVRRLRYVHQVFFCVLFVAIFFYEFVSATFVFMCNLCGTIEFVF